MPKRTSPRKGSLQFWPRKRAKKILPRVNWNAVISSNPSHKGLAGFICYKAGMATAFVKDNTPDSMTKDKKIAVPVTILECPDMKIFSVRFYKNGKPSTEILNKNFEKEIKKKLKIPKNYEEDIGKIKTDEYDDLRIIVYSMAKTTGIKKTPDIAEIGISGSYEDKINFVKENFGKNLSITEFFGINQLVDFRGVTKGKGFQGPVKRFGITLKDHKSEKGVRRPGSLGPWHPARVTFRVPMAGQMGFFTRAVYNKKIVDIGKYDENKDFLKNIKNYGDIRTNYIVVSGSVQGPAKRALILTYPLRETKRTKKKNFELVEIIK